MRRFEPRLDREGLHGRTSCSFNESRRLFFCLFTAESDGTLDYGKMMASSE